MQTIFLFRKHPLLFSKFRIKVLAVGSVAIAFVVVGLSICIDPEPPVSPIQARAKYDALVNAELDKAKQDSERIKQEFSQAVNQQNETFAPQFLAAASAASKAATGYDSTLKLVWRLAIDKVQGSATAEEHLSETIIPVVTPPMVKYQESLQLLTAQFDQDLQKTTVALATNIAAIAQANAMTLKKTEVNGGTSIDFARPLNKLGKDVAFPIVTSIGIDRLVIARVAPIARRLFLKQATRLAATPALSTAGPAGWVLEIALIAWACYDITVARAEFETSVQQSLNENMTEFRTVSVRETLQYASKRSETILRIQDEIAAQALTTTTAPEK